MIWYRKYFGSDYFTFSNGKYGGGVYFSSQENSRFEGENEVSVEINYKNAIIFEGDILPNFNYHKARENSGLTKSEFTDSLFY